MRFKCCEIALNSFMITDSTLSFCYKSLDRKYAFLKNYHGETDFAEKYIISREQYIQNCKEEKNIPIQCQECSFFVEAEWDETFGIKFLGVANRSKCSCNCIYCIVSEGNNERRRQLNTKEVWDIKPVLNVLENKKFLVPYGQLFIAGGECSEYPKEELQWFIDYAKRNTLEIRFASSGIFYSEEIANALQYNRASIIISPDSGTRETYEKIKRVKYYDEVWNNIAKYIKISENNPAAKVVVKYIILSEINDSIEEFQAFLNKCNEVNCQHIDISIDLDWLLDDGGRCSKIPVKVQKLLNYINKINDPRIFSETFTPVTEKKTSAKIYLKDIEDALIKGKTIVFIVVFAALEKTYKQLTNTDFYGDIWSNIEKYSKLVGTDSHSRSQIKIQYKLIPGINDSIEELQNLIALCTKFSLKNIQIDLYHHKKDNTLTNNDITGIKNAFEYLSCIKHHNISFSNEIKEIVNNTKEVYEI